MTSQLVGPFCGNNLSGIIYYEGSGYSERPVFGGVECVYFSCGAVWDSAFQLIGGPCL